MMDNISVNFYFDTSPGKQKEVIETLRKRGVDDIYSNTGRPIDGLRISMSFSSVEEAMNFKCYLEGLNGTMNVLAFGPYMKVAEK